MEPFSTTIGVVASVCGILQVLAGSISALRTLNRRFKGANLIIVDILGLLNTIEAALRQIQAWIEDTLQYDDQQHYQLCIDLDTALTSCRLLISHLDIQISKIEWDEASGVADLTLASRVQSVLHGSSTEELLTRLTRQANALSLLLNACNCRRPAHQKAILEKKASRQLLDKVRDDSSSLLALCEPSSFSVNTAARSTTSKISKVFTFDRELLKHKAYESTFRALMRRTEKTSRSQSLPEVPPLPRAISPTQTDPVRSASIDAAIKAEYRRTKGEVKVLALGLPDSGLTGLLTHMRMLQASDMSPGELEICRTRIFTILVDSLCSALDQLAVSGLRFDAGEAARHVCSIKDHAATKPIRSLPVEVASAIAVLWQEDQLRNKIGLSTPIAYFCDDVQRLAGPGFLPTPSDVLQLSMQISTVNSAITEITVLTDGLTINFIHYPDAELNKLAHLFEGMMSVLFVVKLTSYAHPGHKDPSVSQMFESLEQFRFICHSPYFRKSSIILFFDTTGFEDTLWRIPLGARCSQYRGGRDVTKATNFLMRCFERANQNRVHLYSHLVNATDGKATRVVFDSIKDTILENSLRLAIL